MTVSPPTLEMITSINPHPENDHLTCYRLSNGAETVGNKLEGGKDRYSIGDMIGFIPEGNIVPDWLLQRQEAWDFEKGKGLLSGNRGNKVKTRIWKSSGTKSEGMMVACRCREDDIVVFYLLEEDIMVPKTIGHELGFLAS